MSHLKYLKEEDYRYSIYAKLSLWRQKDSEIQDDDVYHYWVTSKRTRFSPAITDKVLQSTAGRMLANVRVLFRNIPANKEK